MLFTGLDRRSGRTDWYGGQMLSLNVTDTDRLQITAPRNGTSSRVPRLKL